MKKVVYEMASATWVKAPAKFIQASNLFETREMARVEWKVSSRGGVTPAFLYCPMKGMDQPPFYPGDD